MKRIFNSIRYFILIIIYTVYMFGFYIKSLMVPFIRKFSGEEGLNKFKYKSVSKWCRFTFKLIGVKVEYEGIENIPKDTCLFVGNHQGILDIPALMMGANKVVGFIAKKELLKTPIIGKWIMICNSVTIDRDDPRDAVRVIKEGVEILNKGYSMGIYPEGTRAKDGKIKEFKSGSLKLAIRAKVPVVPVTIDGSYKAYELNGKFQATTIKVKYDKPIDTKNLTKEEQKEIAKIIHDKIENNLKEMNKQ